LTGPPETVFGDPERLAALGVAGPEASEAAWEIGRLEGEAVRAATVDQAAQALARRLDQARGVPGRPPAGHDPAAPGLPP
jgi:hypothetical protein